MFPEAKTTSSSSVWLVTGIKSLAFDETWTQYRRSQALGGVALVDTPPIDHQIGPSRTRIPA